MNAENWRKYQMNLKEYLFFERKSITNFAKELQLNRTYMNLIVNQKVKPSKRLAKDIEIATQGKVSAAEVLSVPKQSK